MKMMLITIYDYVLLLHYIRLVKIRRLKSRVDYKIYFYLLIMQYRILPSLMITKTKNCKFKTQYDLRQLLNIINAAITGAKNL